MEKLFGTMNYISKIWLMTVFGTPFLYWPIIILINDSSLFNLIESFPVLFMSMVATCVLSLPTFFILSLCLNHYSKQKYRSESIKNRTALITVFGVLITFAILDFSIFYSFKGVLFPGSYILMLCFSSYFFNTDVSN